MIKNILKLLTSADKKLIIYLCFFSLLVSIIELVGISAIMPFLSMATDFEIIHTNKYLSFLYDMFNYNNEITFIISFGLVLILFYLFRSAVNLIFVYSLNKFNENMYYLFTMKLFKKYMSLSYLNFIQKNSSNMTKIITQESSLFSSLLTAYIFILSEILVIILIYSMLLYTNLMITLSLTAFLSLKIILIKKTISKKIKTIGEERSVVQSSFYETINKTFKNFKIIKLIGHSEIATQEFEKHSFKYSRINIVNTTLQHIPKLLLEAVSFSILILIALYFLHTNQKDLSSILGVLTLFVLALYRLIPSLNRIIAQYNIIMFNYESLNIISNELSEMSEVLGKEEIKFSQTICLKDICFSYNKEKIIFDKFNFTIQKNEIIGIMGSSGEGKSTLIDIITGLYKPDSGSILLDNNVLEDSNLNFWRNQIGYIPQNIYLFDGTVENNVIFGRERDVEQVIKCLKMANIYDTLIHEKEGLKTNVGEGGALLSGGQKQRIAIARALYSNPQILILDESTSALDKKTEGKIMEEVYSLCQDKTLLIITHNAGILNQCHKIYNLKNGKLKNV